MCVCVPFCLVSECEAVQWVPCCSYISVQFVPDLKLKFHFQVVNCLPLRPLAHSELKFKLAWPRTTALQHLGDCLTLSLPTNRCFALCPLIPPIISSSLFLSSRVILSPSQVCFPFFCVSFARLKFPIFFFKPSVLLPVHLHVTACFFLSPGSHQHSSMNVRVLERGRHCIDPHLWKWHRWQLLMITN